MIRIGELEKKYVLEVLETQFKASKGADNMTRLEEEFAEKFNTKYAISHVNGTATMHTALLAAGVGPGDEVIVPPLTFAATAFVVLFVGDSNSLIYSNIFRVSNSRASRTCY